MKEISGDSSIRMEMSEINARRLLQPYAKGSDRSAWLQLTNSLIPYLTLWAFVLTVESPAWALFVAIPIVLLTVRLFILQHDCGHSSLFNGQRSNDIVGCLLSLITLTPFYNWRIVHNMHHATSGNLDRRSFGDIWLMTVDEYVATDRWTRLRYRIYRHPLFLFLIGPGFYFLIRRRFPVHLEKHMTKARRNVYWTNLSLFFFYGSLVYFFGWERVALVTIPVIALSSGIGVWLFYVQHNFEGTYWNRNEDWKFFDGGILGSSYYDLPPWLQWFTADIAVHHIHHIESRIPNYRLQECLRENPEFSPTARIGFMDSLRLPSLKLWDESRGRLVGYPT